MVVDRFVVSEVEDELEAQVIEKCLVESFVVDGLVGVNDWGVSVFLRDEEKEEDEGIDEFEGG